MGTVPTDGEVTERFRRLQRRNIGRMLVRAEAEEVRIGPVRRRGHQGRLAEPPFSARPLGFHVLLYTLVQPIAQDPSAQSLLPNHFYGLRVLCFNKAMNIAFHWVMQGMEVLLAGLWGHRLSKIVDPEGHST